MLETKKTEERYFTSDPRKMLNKWTASRVLKKWTEDFIDEDKGEVVSIERNEVLFDRATLIDQDTLAQIRFYIEAGDIKEVEVTNQKRAAYALENTYLNPHIAQAQIGDKKYKFLFYSSSIDKSLELLKDYIELNYQGGFSILMIKEFDSCIILTDTLKSRIIDSDTNEPEVLSEKEDTLGQKKFYQIESLIKYGEAGEEGEITKTFVVHTFNVERAMMIINNYLNNLQEKRKQEAEQKGNEYKVLQIHTMIESAKPLPVGCFIPKEFSEAYIG